MSRKVTECVVISPSIDMRTEVSIKIEQIKLVEISSKLNLFQRSFILTFYIRGSSEMHVVLFG